MYNYEYDEKNIAKSIQKAMSIGADPLAVKYLNDARKSKIEAGGEATAMYKNDALSRAADEYVESFNKTNTEKLADARIKMQADNLKSAKDAANARYERGLEENKKTSSDARRLYIADAQKNQIDTEAALARLGLGRGINADASSGFSESARAMLLSDAAEGLNAIYEKERDKNNELISEREESVRKAEEAYANNVDNAYAQQAENELEADKNYTDTRLSLIDMSNKNRQSESELEADMEKFVLELELEQRKFDSDKDQREFERALDAFAAAGVVTNQDMADILGLSVGTQYWQYISDLIKANAAASNAATNRQQLDINKTNTLIDMLNSITNRVKVNNERKKNDDMYGL